MTIEIVTAATSYPVSVAEQKAHCRVDVSADDTYIGAVIGAATDWVEHRTGRQLVTATLRQSWDSYPSVFHPPRVITQAYGARVWYMGMEASMLTLDREPVQSVSSVKYYDITDTLQTVNASTYWVDLASTPPRIVPKDAWPNILFGRPNAFQITFVAGYGVASAVPLMLKQAVMMLAAHWYEQRESVKIGAMVTEVPQSVESICQMYETRLV